MGRELPILLAQDIGLRSRHRARDFEHDLRERLAAQPQTRLVVYPELHLCPGTDQDAVEAPAEPVPAPRSKRLPVDLGGLRRPGR